MSTAADCRVPGTVISKVFVAELMRDFCQFLSKIGVTSTVEPDHLEEEATSLTERLGILRELCESEPKLVAHLCDEYAPIFSASFGPLLSLQIAKLQESASPNSASLPADDVALCAHFLAVCSALIKCAPNVLIRSDQQDGGHDDQLPQLCFCAIERMAPRLMAASFDCLVRMLSLGSDPLNTLILDHFSQRLASLVSVVLRDSLCPALIEAVWRFLHQLISNDQTNGEIFRDFLPDLASLVLADPSLLSLQIPFLDHQTRHPLPLYTLIYGFGSNPNSVSENPELFRLLRKQIDKFEQDGILLTDKRAMKMIIDRTRNFDED